MAAPNSRFSIREYAAKRRKVDLANSFPFALREEEKPNLPPISKRAFRWWSDELNAARSAFEISDSAAETAVEKADYQPAKSKKKTRSRKKRSIIEIFASAPQIEIEIRASKKEKECKPTNKKVHQNRAESVAERKKIAKLKIFQKKNNILQSPNSVSENQKAVKKLPTHSILKNKKSFSSARKSIKINNTKKVKFIKHYGKITKQVPFSEDENILGHNKNFSASKAKRFPTGNNGPHAVKQSEEETNVEESSSQRNHSSDLLSNADHTKSMATIIDLNHAIDTSNDLDYFNPSAENSSFEGNFVSVSNDVDLLTTMMNPSQDNPTCLIDSNEKQNVKHFKDYFDVDMNCTHHIPENQSEHHYSPKDLLNNNICHSMGSNKLCESLFLSNLVSTSLSKGSGEDFIVLPVKKQGELIQMLPGMNFVGPYMNQNIDLASTHGFYTDMQAEQNINLKPLRIMKERDLDAALYQNDQFNWCSNQQHPIRERIFGEFIDLGRFKIQKNETVGGNYAFFNPHLNKTRLYFHDGGINDASIDFFKKEDHIAKSNSNRVMQSTIRLMGQDVVVGDSDPNFQCSILPQKYHYNEAFGSSTDSLLKTDKFLVNNILEEESMRHQYYSTISSCQHNIQHSECVTNGTFLTPQSMYQYKVHENSLQSDQKQPSENLPQWLHQTKHLRRNQLSSSSYSSQIGLSGPFRNTGTDRIPHLSQYNMPPMIPLSNDNISPATSTFDPNSSQSSYKSVVTENNSISEVTKSTLIKNKEGSYCKFTGFSSPINGYTFLNSVKRPQLERNENL